MSKVNKVGSVVTVVIKHSALNSGLRSICDEQNKVSYSNFSKFISNYVRFIFERQSPFFLRSRHLSSEVEQHQQTYIFGSHHFNENAKNVFVILRKYLEDLSFDERKQIIYLFIHRLSEIFSKKNNLTTIMENFENISSISVFMRNFWQYIIEPNKRCIENPWNEASVNNNTALNVFLFLPKEEFSEAINLLTLPQDRHIHRNLLLKNQKNEIIHLDVLFNSFNQWNDADIIKFMIAQPSLINNPELFNKFLHNHISDVNRLEFYQQHKKRFLKFNINAESLSLFIKFTQGLNKETCHLLVCAVNEKIVTVSALKNNGIDLIQYILSNFSEFSSSEVISLLQAEGQKIPFNNNEMYNFALKTLATDNSTECRQTIAKIIREASNNGTPFEWETFLKMAMSRPSYASALHSKEIFKFWKDMPEEKVIAMLSAIGGESICNNKQKKEAFICLLTVSVTVENAFSLAKNLGYYKNIYSIFGNGNSDSKNYTRGLVKISLHNDIWFMLDHLFQTNNLDISGEAHKGIFNLYVDELRDIDTQSAYKKGYVFLRENPLHQLLTRIIYFYNIEANSAKTRELVSLNSEVWNYTNTMLKIFKKLYGKQLLEQPDFENNGMSFKDKLEALQSTIRLNENSASEFDFSSYCHIPIITWKNKMLFWKEQETVKETYDYLYIFPQGPHYSNEILPEFIEQTTSNQETWDKTHEEAIKKLYSLMQVSDISAEISLDCKELIRNFKKISEQVEPVKDQIGFEAEMFFKSSFFKDLQDVLNTHAKSIKSIRVLQQSEMEAERLLSESKLNCNRVLGLLRTQLKHITNDIHQNLLARNNFDMDVLAEYIKSKNYGVNQNS